MKAHALIVLLTIPSLARAERYDYPSRFVVVRRDVALHAKPNAASHHVRVIREADAKEATNSWATYRWVADHGDFVEIETVGYTDSNVHCYDGEWTLNGLKLLFYVKK